MGKSSAALLTSGDWGHHRLCLVVEGDILRNLVTEEIRILSSCISHGAYQLKNEGKRSIYAHIFDEYQIKNKSYNRNETLVRILFLPECCNKFGKMWMHFHDAVEVFDVDFFSPGTNFVRKYMITRNSWDSQFIIGKYCTHGGIHVQKRADGTWNPSCDMPKGLHSLR
jgi:hypothetical protein